MLSTIEILIIFVSIVSAYFLIVGFLHKFGLLDRFNISLYGPALMFKTKKGIKFLKKVASKRKFWKAFGKFGIAFCFLMMIIMILLLILNAWLVMGFSPEQKEALPGPEVMLVLPGINPILPLEYLGYIILAFVIGIVVHEFSHGILALAQDLKVKSLGILYMILPIGAFCEPDEEELNKTSTLKRMRVYAAGPLANFTVVFISIILFSFVFLSAVYPVEGVEVWQLSDDSPADKIDLKPGSVITSINNTEVNGFNSFYTSLNNTYANQTVTVTYFREGENYTKQVTLADKSEYTKNESHEGKGFLGVTPNPWRGYIQHLKKPFSNFPQSFLLLYSLPFFGYFQGYNPIVSPYTSSYVITGSLSVLPTGVFWGVVNALFWVLWLNLAIALFNVLPMFPLDGGFLFNDAIGSALDRIKKGLSDEKREIIVKKISTLLSLIILFSIIFPYLIKYI